MIKTSLFADQEREAKLNKLGDARRPDDRREHRAGAEAIAEQR
jgi:hypothetical protein